MEVVQNSLSLFVPPPVDNTIEKEYWVEFNPIAAITDAGVIEFNIPGTSTDYVNLRTIAAFDCAHDFCAVETGCIDFSRASVTPFISSKV